MQTITAYLESWTNPQGFKKWLAIAFILIIIIGNYYFVYQSGGIQCACSAPIYLSIIFASIFFQIRGGFITALLAGIALGPLMPANVNTGDLQTPFDILMRTGTYIISGLALSIPFQLYKYYLDKLKFLTYHDHATSIYNRRALFRDLNNTSEKPLHVAADTCLIAINFNNIPEITSLFSFEAGDAIIVENYNRLKKILPHSTKIYHYHRDRLAIVITNGDFSNITNIIDEIENVIKPPVVYNKIPLFVETFIGYVHTDNDTTKSRSLICQADTALLYAKEQNIAFAPYSAELETNRKNDLILLGSVTDAIQFNHFSLHYQPKMNLSTMETTGFEGLLRWQHPELGNVPPLRFIPQVEKTALINPLTYWVLERALKNQDEWLQKGIQTNIAINVSSHNLVSTQFADDVLKLMDTYHTHYDTLEFEVTETALMVNPEKSIEVLSRLRDIHIIISIDDFGTGYSSLAYLHRLPATKIKISQWFTQKLTTDAGIREIVTGAIELVHRLNLKVIAEGIEDEATLHLLQQLGCDFGQGYLFSRPLPEPEALAWIQAKNNQHAKK